MGIAIIIGIIVAAGLLGGSANYYMEQANGSGFRKSVLLGLTASATVPLFLKTVSSSLLDECIKGDPAFFSSYFVFFGFCTVAAIFSSKFLQSLGDKLLQELKDVKQKQEELTETTDVLVAENSDPAETSNPAEAPVDAPKTGSEFEAYIPGQTEKAPESAFVSDEQKIMGALKGKYAFRTVDGVAKDAGMDQGSVQAKLLEMELKGKVKKTKRARDGVMVWSLR